MTLDEASKAIRSVCDAQPVRDLARLVEEWKHEERDAAALETMVERFFGHVWIEPAQAHADAWRIWSEFRDEAIRDIGGMTMNERLYAFSLFDRYDACKSEAERRVVYAKVLAKP